MSQAHNKAHNNRRQHGFTLVELMVAMVLGLVVIGGVVSVFLSNQQSYRTNQALGEVQDNSRIAFELMARDIRDAGLTGCGNTDRVANVLNASPNGTGTQEWWANWGNAVIGYDNGVTDPAVTTGTNAGQRVSTTDSIELIGAEGTGLSVQAPSANAANFKLNEPTSSLQSGDIIIVCDPDHAAIVQITNYTNSNVTIVHNSGNGSGTPGNCSKGLGFPTDCSSANGNAYPFGENSQIAQLAASDWYIGYNSVGGRSLYRVVLANSGGVSAPSAPQEMVRNINDMQITYHQNTVGYAHINTFEPASNITNWSDVDAVQVKLTLQSENQRAGTDVQPIQRIFTTTTTLRNRVD